MYLCLHMIVFFYVCKQKTACEMLISDWMSDVCSSDLRGFLTSIRMCDPVRAAAADFSHEPFCEEGKAEPGLIFETVALRRIKGQGNVPAHRIGDSAQGLGAALERSAGIKGFKAIHRRMKGTGTLGRESGRERGWQD